MPAPAVDDSLSGLRVGVPVTYFDERMEAGVADLYGVALVDLEALGAVLVDVPMPFAQGLVDVAFTLAKAEAGYLHRDRIARARDELGDDVRAFLDASASVSALDYITALRRQAEVRQAAEALFGTVDVIATPTVPITAKPLEQDQDVEIDGCVEPLFDFTIRYTSPFNVSGHPALSLPCGLTGERLPVGLQLVAALGAEGTLLQAAHVYQQAVLAPYLRELDRLSLD